MVQLGLMSHYRALIIRNPPGLSPLFSDQVVTPLYALSVNFRLSRSRQRTDRFKWLVVHVLRRDEGLVKVAAGDPDGVFLYEARM